MRKLLSVFAIFFLIFSVFTFTARIIKDKRGNVVEVFELSPEERTAVNNPSDDIPITSKTKTEYKRTSFFFYTQKEKYKNIVVFKEGKLNTIEKTGEMSDKKVFAWHLVLFIVVIILITTLNMCKKLDPFFFKNDATATIGIVSLLVGATGLIVSVVKIECCIVVSAFAYIAEVAMLVMFNFLDSTKVWKGVYKITLIIFYIAYAVAMLYDFII